MEQDKQKPTPGDIARQKLLQPGEIFITNFSSLSLARGPYMTTSGNPEREMKKILLKSGNYESVRTEQNACDSDGRVLYGSFMAIGIPKKD